MPNDTMIAVELSLNEAGEDAFLRLSRALPALAGELTTLAKALRGLGHDLIPTEGAKGVGEAAFIDELASDLSVVLNQVQDATLCKRILDVLAKLDDFRVWRAKASFATPQSPAPAYYPFEGEATETVGVFMRVPPHLATQFPRKDEDPSPIHSTLLMVGKCTPDEYRRVVQAARSVASTIEPFTVRMSDYGEFKNDKGMTIAHIIPRAEGPTSLEDLHQRLRAQIQNALGRPVDHHEGPFKSHVTLGYVPPGETYKGPRPDGAFRSSSIEVWGDPHYEGGKFGRTVVRLGTGDVVDILPSNKRDTSGKSADTRVGSQPYMGARALPAEQEGPRRRPKHPPDDDEQDELGGAPGENTGPAALNPYDESRIPFRGTEGFDRQKSAGTRKDGVSVGAGEGQSGMGGGEGGGGLPPAQGDMSLGDLAQNGGLLSPAQGRGRKKPKLIRQTGMVGDEKGQESAKHPPGVGKAESVTVTVDPNELAAGIHTELEHTADPREAMQIALDHLEEIPDYYTRLATCLQNGQDKHNARRTVRARANEEHAHALRQLTKRLHVTFVSKAEEEEQRTVLGIVLEPETVDAQNDIYNEREIEKTAWRFLESYQQFGYMHRMIVPGILPLESYIAPVDFEVGGQKVKKGTWLLRVRVLDDEIWRDVKSGKLTGFSIGGSAVRRPDGDEGSEAA